MSETFSSAAPPIVAIDRLSRQFNPKVALNDVLESFSQPSCCSRPITNLSLIH